MQHFPIHWDRTWFDTFQTLLEQDMHWSTWERFQLAIEAAEALVVPNFDTLLSLQQIHGFVPLPHQIEVVHRVMGEMRGRAILADEVGLGKTIEAGLILKEYLIRGLVKNALILVPSSLVLQWTRELNQKFQIPAVAQKKEWMWDRYPILVASMDTAKREPHRNHILNKNYDILIIDEAHKLKNRRTKNWQFINEIKKKYCLLLTATPIQNELEELYNLVTLLKPGQLGRQSHFQNEYVAGKRKAKNEEQLREEIQRVLIRNRRRDQNLHLTKRVVQTIPIELSPEERALYEAVTEFVRNRYSQATDLKSMLSLLVLQKEVCSSRDAVFHTLFKLFQRGEQGKESLSPEVAHLVDLLRQVTISSKVQKAVELIKTIPDKVIIFTEYRATQEMLIRALAKEKIHAIPYRGGFNRNKKDWMMELFQKRAQVMVATEAGGEGINLQFCHHIINYDMPWNPMRVEQRIGRVHRLGQKNDVHIYNFATKNTIEEHIIWLLQEKINLFETVIGELETILDDLEKEESIEQSMMRIVLEANDHEQIRERLSEWGDKFTQKKQVVIEKKQEQEGLLYGSAKG
ncbi:DEAD/DEAH box helicase [Thermoflavimicrobium dichotomicum]|uniref:Helicase conserved C-terminal domain-containing protein n=1 Tax=Thermoflavimicrobium dichotomicum TaxID=46223 RepID=A0A1I3QG22_9BACL|nr:SNF2-related protein [Thermoflavimicrobium dichotomicum]SFJ32509.1 Helicase conserved C-terminal domain-containing protein [Thermoflavimicrobium dichotomicum]